MDNNSGALILLIVLIASAFLLIVLKLAQFVNHFSREKQHLLTEMHRAADYNEYRYWRRELRCLYLCLIPFVTEQIFANVTFTFTVNAAAGTAITLAPKWGTNSHDATLHNDDFITATGSQQSKIQAPDNSVTAKPSAEPTAPTTPTTPTTPSSAPAESATTAPEPSATAPTEPEP